MSDSIDVERFFEQFSGTRKQASVEAVFGAPIESNGKTVIPIASAIYGFGLGVNAKNSQTAEEPGGDHLSGGGSGGFITRPMALAIVDQDGVKVEPIVNAGWIALNGMLTGAWLIFWLGRVLLRLASQKKE